VSGAEVIVEHVRKAFEHGRIRALEDVSLRLAPGELVALTGPSGAGKSTLLNLIGALDRPDAGTIAVDGTLLDGSAAAEYRARTVGFVFQFHNLIPVLSAVATVQIPMVGRATRAVRVKRATELLGEVGLGGRAEAFPPTLSGGERQRVAIARALANDPRVLLADEPTGALDSETGEQIVALLQRLRESRGMTILLVTNDRAIAQRADRVVELRDGRLLLAAEGFHGRETHGPQRGVDGSQDADP
jgi:putative ABC transport system ATP-binding protein